MFCDALFLRFHGSCSRASCLHVPGLLGSCSRASCLHVLGLLGSCFRVPSSRRSSPETESQRQKRRRGERERERERGTEGRGERERKKKENDQEEEKCGGGRGMAMGQQDEKTKRMRELLSSFYGTGSPESDTPTGYGRRDTLQGINLPNFDVDHYMESLVSLILLFLGTLPFLFMDLVNLARHTYPCGC